MGVIDPGWKGPLATALVNFSGGKISIKKGDAFFRVMVFSHNKTDFTDVTKSRDGYISEILDRSRLFAQTFLDTHSLVDEVAAKVFKFPKLAVAIGWAGLGIALASIFAPMTVNVWLDHRNTEIGRIELERRVGELERVAKLPRPEEASQVARVAKPTGEVAVQHPSK